ncbi:MAG: hypothetical protein NTV51_15420 [Verrucomicrobia bacterium]|nr:hypothetical protein [Verrucomicrobiota bacterium]
MKFSRLLALVLGLTAMAMARATTVVPPSFDELVQASELVFRGRVTAVKSDWAGEGKARHLATWVTFAVERTLRGSAGGEITLEFMGGESGAKRLVLAGWPQFAVGDRGVFFVEQRLGRVCPLMRLRHGKYRIVGEAGTASERVMRDDGTPLKSATDVSAPLVETSGANRAVTSNEALSLRNFEAQIETRSSELARKETVR